jgi:hypothetical protein
MPHLWVPLFRYLLSEAGHNLDRLRSDKNHPAGQTFPFVSPGFVCHKFTPNLINAQEGDYPNLKMPYIVRLPRRVVKSLSGPVKDGRIQKQAAEQ